MVEGLEKVQKTLDEKMDDMKLRLLSNSVPVEVSGEQSRTLDSTSEIIDDEDEIEVKKFIDEHFRFLG